MGKELNVRIDTDNPHYTGMVVLAITDTHIHLGYPDNVTRYMASAVIVDGLLLVDEETGECLGTVHESGFTADNPEGAEWVLQKMAELRAKAEYWDLRPEVAAARMVIVNAEKLARAERKRLEFLEWRFKAELQKLVEDQIATKAIKGKTWTCLYGSVALKAKAEAVKVADTEAAATWAEGALPDAVRVKKEFMISQITPEEKAWLIENAKAGTDPELTKAFTYEPESTTVIVTSGAKL